MSLLLGVMTAAPSANSSLNEVQELCKMDNFAYSLRTQRNIGHLNLWHEQGCSTLDASCQRVQVLSWVNVTRKGTECMKMLVQQFLSVHAVVCLKSACCSAPINKHKVAEA